MNELGEGAAEFCEKMGFKVFDPPKCYNGVPLGQTLQLQPNTNFSRRSNRGIVSITWSELFNGIKQVFWYTPKVLSILMVIVAFLISCLFGFYQFNLW